MNRGGLDTIESLREWRAALEQADVDLAERERLARDSDDRAELDVIATARDDIGAQWDELAQRHDAWARSRDMQGLKRDKRSSDRDVAARRLAADQDPAFSNRWHSAIDRDDSGGDRADSFDDRHDANDARERAAGNRDRAATDRDAAAATAAGQAAEVRDLHQQAESSTVIGQACGLLMARRGLSTDDAFTELVRLSQTSNMKLRDAAAALVADAQPDHT